MSLSFRSKLILASSASLLVLFATLTVILGREQERIIVSGIRDSALALTRNTAALSLSSLKLYDSVALERIARQAATQGRDARHVIIHTENGLVYGHSHKPEAQFTFLSDPISRRALDADGPFIQQYASESGEPLLEVAMPVMDERGLRWGTVRAGFSLTSMHDQLRHTRLLLLGTGLASLCGAWLISFLLARRVTAPLQAITAAARSISKGALAPIPEVRTGDEIAVLADSISDMTATLVGQQKSLKDHLKEISALKGYQDSLLQTMNEGLVTLGPEGEVVTFNARALDILGVEAREGHVARAEIRAKLEDFRDVLPTAGRLLASAGAQADMREIAGPGGKIVLAGFAALSSDSGTREVIVTLHDITELRRLEQEVKRNERLAAIGSFSAAMAHEIRNPLTAIKAYTGMVWKKAGRPEFVQRFDRNVSAGIERIEGLVNDLLRLSRPPSFQLEPVDVGEVLEDALDLLREDIDAAGIALTFDREACGHVLVADREQLYRALFNILLNAVQSMQAAGPVRKLAVAATVDQEATRAGSRGVVGISVADTGPGIPPQNLEQIFNPYFTTKGRRGMGLGLAITHKIVTEHGGSISAANSPEGGAVFCVVLPLDGPGLMA